MWLLRRTGAPGRVKDDYFSFKCVFGVCGVVECSWMCLDVMGWSVWRLLRSFASFWSQLIYNVLGTQAVRFRLKRVGCGERKWRVTEEVVRNAQDLCLVTWRCGSRCEMKVAKLRYKDFFRVCNALSQKPFMNVFSWTSPQVSPTLFVTAGWLNKVALLRIKCFGDIPLEEACKLIPPRTACVPSTL